MGGKNYLPSLIVNPHNGLQYPEDPENLAFAVLVQGDYTYYHYGCDGIDDRGWGCGYRTLMTICSWIKNILQKSSKSELRSPPTNLCIQQTLIDIGDKTSLFLGSREWIGCFEAGLVIDELYKVPCKIIHINEGSQLGNHVDGFRRHFETNGSPVMMGGDSDNISKCIVGVCQLKNEPRTCFLLVVDPHFWGETRDPEYLQAHGWVAWKALDSFSQTSFYNLCLPQLHLSDSALSKKVDNTIAYK